jgi:hypothetical protein
MIDDRLLRAFVAFEAPAEPDATFSERLFEDLATELGLRREVRPAGSLGGRLLRALGVERLPVGAPALRLAYLAALIGLLIVAMAAALLVASQLLRPRPVTPTDLVRLSQAAYAEAPAVRMTIHTPFVDAIVSSDGQGTWRSETSGEFGDAPGSYSLYDGTRVGYYDPSVRVWKVVPLENGGPPYPFNDAFTWTHIDFPGERATLSPVPCTDATDLGESAVAGRVVDGVGCPGVDMEYWIDRATHLVLRTVAGQQSPYWSGAANHDSVTEVTAFEEVAAAAAPNFSWEGPPDALPPDAPLASTVLVVGERPPAWSARTIGGPFLSTDDLGHPAAILVFDPTRDCCDAAWSSAYDDFAAVAPGIPGLTPVLVGRDEIGDMSLVTGFVLQHPTDIPVVNDMGAVSKGWGITGEPALVLIGRDGTVSSMTRSSLTRDDLRRMLTALVAGDPIPSIEPAPSPTPTPGDPSLDPSVVCSEELGTCMPIGSRMPAWSLPLMQGGSIGSADLLGAPSVIVFANTRCEGPCPEWVLTELQGLAAMIEEYRGRASFVIVSDGEIESGDTQALFSDAGVDIPLVFDWDGSLSGRFLLIVGSALVFDGEGRYVDHVAFPGVAGIRAVLDPLVASPSPAASP